MWPVRCRWPCAACPIRPGRAAQVDVRLVLPLHRVLRAKSATLRPVVEFPVYRRGRSMPARVFEMSMAGMPVYFISGEPISNATYRLLPGSGTGP